MEPLTSSHGKPQHDPLPPFVRQVLELYADALMDVRFPDVDLTVLRGADQALQQAQLALERIESELTAARAAVDARRETLAAQAERALAYARVYAANDAALAGRIADIAGRKKVVPAAPGAARKRRGRAPHGELADELFRAEGAHEAAPDSQGVQSQSVGQAQDALQPATHDANRAEHEPDAHGSADDIQYEARRDGDRAEHEAEVRAPAEAEAAAAADGGGRAEVHAPAEAEAAAAADGGGGAEAHAPAEAEAAAADGGDRSAREVAGGPRNQRVRSTPRRSKIAYAPPTT